jgi:hypothetical protein
MDVKCIIGSDNGKGSWGHRGWPWLAAPWTPAGNIGAESSRPTSCSHWEAGCDFVIACLPLAVGGQNIDINKQIMRAQGASKLCTLIEARAAEFNHVNAVTAFRALLQSRRDGEPRGVVERALQTLEAAALRTIETFWAREVANTLHIIAKTRYRPWDRALIPNLEGPAEAVAGTFNAVVIQV